MRIRRTAVRAALQVSFCICIEGVKSHRFDNSIHRAVIFGPEIRLLNYGIYFHLSPVPGIGILLLFVDQSRCQHSLDSEVLL